MMKEDTLIGLKSHSCVSLKGYGMLSKQQPQRGKIK